MRKVVAAGLAAVLGAVLAGCGGGAGDSGTSTVTMWMYPVIEDQAKSRAFWDKVEKDFEAANAGIDVKVDLQPWEGRQEKVTTALVSKKGFDLVVLGPDQIPQYAAQGTIAPVDDVVADAKDAFRPSALAALTTDGALYGVPIYQTITSPIFDRKVFTDAGVTTLPTTWDEVKAAAPKLAANGVPVLMYPGAPETSLNLSFYPILWSYGGSVFAPDGKSVAFNGPEGVRALQMLLDLQAAGGLPANAATLTNVIEGGPLSQGKSGFYHAAANIGAVQLGAALGPENVAVGLPIQGTKRVAFGIPGGLVLAKASKSLEAAKKFAAYVASPEVSAALSKESGYFTARTDAKVEGRSATATEFEKSLEFAFPGDTHPLARQVMTLLSPEIQAALQGRKSAQQALDDAAKQADEQLAAAR
ncbi:extracellular solute-binding protein [Pseudonocardia sp. TRM90224]|uniref:extracellular solute-binding protein n=1 Tax=Pseudonocardia sp. TRM90224 TaxID=2812678 RepID=UPI001E5B8DAC|nr:extracellular solute-binding protein [Pseudonocardia sp. TRM90224]